MTELKIFEIKKTNVEKIGDILKNKKPPIPGKEKEAFVRFDVSVQKLRDGFTQIPNLIIDDYKLDCQEKAVLVALYRHAYGKDGCFPSIKLLAQEAGCSRDSIIRKTKTLIKKGYLLKLKTGKYNTYTLVLKVVKSKY